jgi:S1-C subfamily serine protease
MPPVFFVAPAVSAAGSSHSPIGPPEWRMRYAANLSDAGVMSNANPLAELSQELTRAVETGGAAVVAVHGRPQVPSSGILWNTGVVVTTDHTLRRNDDITVTLADGRNLPATLAGRDPGTDLAVLRVPDAGGAAPKTADGASVKAGSLVVALGRRGADGISASLGVVSAISGEWRTWRGGQVDRFIRPDVNIYVGFSGGALVDGAGNIIGLNTTGLTRGTGVTIPPSTISRVTDELLSRGHIRRGFLGVGLHPVKLPDGREGLIVLSLEKEGPAAQAGIYPGDVLLAMAGKPVTSTDEVAALLDGSRIGQPVDASFVRGGAPLELRITPAERPRRSC